MHLALSQNKEGQFSSSKEVQAKKKKSASRRVARTLEQPFPAKGETNDVALLLTGTSKSGVQYKGHVEIPNLSDENSVDEVEVCAS